MFAIVDIETTGGYATANGITEIAIAIFDGQKVVDYFETLINPQMPIPRYIQSLTGITNAMISQAPLFEEVAEKIYDLLKGKVFVAHNVNFDYSFVKHHLGVAGLTLDSKKLCTVRLSRKILPGFASYSLGTLCRNLGIANDSRHRAGGDTQATVQLFEKLLAADASGELKAMLKGRSKHQHLPANLPVEKMDELPALPGVYYFHNQKGKVVYVGKAKDLRKRVSSHFSNNKPGQQKQEFLRNIYNITHQVCGTELMAFILESIEIKRLWPLYNRSQKGFEPAYGLYMYEDAKGYQRLFIEKKKKQLQSIYSFNSIVDGHVLLKKMITRFNLCPRLCFIDQTAGPLLPEEMQLSVTEYNERVLQSVEELKQSLPSFALVEASPHTIKEEMQSVIVMEKGRFVGMGYLPRNVSINTITEIKEQVTVYPENNYIRGLIYQYAEKFPEKKVILG
jgi:DNA polymerase III subunit epsilon